MSYKDIIDVSRYQGTIDWEQLVGKIGGAMLKTVSTNKSFGGIYIDPQFERNYAECKRLGIPVGVYYYTYAQTKATADAELAKLHEALEGKRFDLPIAVDVEDNKLKPLSAAALSELVAYAADTWCTPTPTTATPSWTWTPWPPMTSGSPTTAASGPPASTGCGSIPAPAAFLASTPT